MKVIDAHVNNYEFQAPTVEGPVYSRLTCDSKLLVIGSEFCLTPGQVAIWIAMLTSAQARMNKDGNERSMRTLDGSRRGT